MSLSLHGFLLIAFLFLANATHNTKPASPQLQGSNGTKEMIPMFEQGKMENMLMLLNQTTRRRRLGSFHICALCTCCGGANRVCLPSPCCYAINCNVPNRPFGFCSFTPKTCNCFRCHL